MSTRQKRTLIRIIVSGVLFAALLLFPLSGWVRLGAFLAVYLLIGCDVIWAALRGVIGGQLLDEHFLMLIATAGAFAIGEYPEGVAVMLFYQLGEWFQSYAVGRSRRSIAALMDIRPDYASLRRDGQLVQVDPDEVAPGDLIVIRPGEKIPLDGEIESGNSFIDSSAMTGESLPRRVQPGDPVLSGCINGSGLLEVRVTKAFGESTVSKVLELVENAAGRKARTESFITRFARYYTPIVVGAAVLLAVLPPLLLGSGWQEHIRRALNFLIVSCPCALVISVPLSFFGGIGGASKSGILVKGGNYLEALADAQIIVFDKTGTLTRGVFEVVAAHPQEMTPERLLELAALAEGYSEHPIAQSIRAAYGGEIDTGRIADYQDIPGRGVCAQVDGQSVCAGNEALMRQVGAAARPCHKFGTIVHVSLGGRYAGHIVIADSVKEEAAYTIAALKAQGVRKTVMLTGDAQAIGEHVAAEVGLDEMRAQLLPTDKVGQVERLLAEKTGRGKLVFVGDGVNDAPVLARADVGVAMGALGSDAAIEAADVVLMDDRLSRLATAIGISRRTMRIVYENIVFALGVKAVVLVLSALGIASMWAAVFADVGVSILAVLNAMRSLKAMEK